jgi:hypothetical protein
MRERSRHALAITAVAAGCLTAAAPAGADVLYRGKTGQGLRAGLRTSDQGEMRVMRFHWAVRCRRPGFRAMNSTAFRPPFARPGTDFLADGGPYVMRIRDGIRLHIDAGVRARRRSATRWTGTFRISIVVKKRGRVLDRCGPRRVRWRVASR